MTIQATARSALVLAAMLIAASALDIAGTGVSYAAGDSVFPDPPQMSSQAASDSAASATSDATPVDQQQQVDQQAAPAMPTPVAGNAVADNTDPASTATDATVNAATVSNDDNSGWDKASIIGKIFIACGTLLTLGSAARMFMI